MSITRTIEFDDITPEELAILFTEMDDYQQARFFSGIWRIARNWEGAGWCQQSCSIVSRLEKDGRDALETLAAHLQTDARAGEA